MYCLIHGIYIYIYTFKPSPAMRRQSEECHTWFLSWAISLLLGALLFRWSSIICASARRTLVLFKSFFSLFSVSKSLWFPWMTNRSSRFFFNPPSKTHSTSQDSPAVSFQSKNVSHTKSHTLNCTDRDWRQGDGSTWSCEFSSLDSSSRLSRNTFCLSSYSSSSCTSICFSCGTYEQSVSRWFEINKVRHNTPTSTILFDILHFNIDTNANSNCILSGFWIC